MWIFCQLLYGTLFLIGSSYGLHMEGYEPPASSSSTSLQPYDSVDCKEHYFEKRPQSHMFAGKEFVHKYSAKHYSNNYILRKCQDTCLQDKACIGLDWVSKDRKCYLLQKDSLTWGGPHHSPSVDHYKRCPKPFKPLKKYPPKYHGYGKQAAATTNVATTTGQPATTVTGATGAVASSAVTTNAAVTQTTLTTTSTAAATTTIPDTGCPFLLNKQVGMSHPFGKNITNGTLYSDVESCKQYCVYRPWCKGVDFDSMTNTCYELRAVNTNLLSANPTVTHFEKTACPPPLKCWVKAATTIDGTNVAIQYPGGSQVICNGVCFAREVMSQTTTTIERGCMTGTGFHLGCMVGMTDLTTITCLCDTDRCNGLSISALTSQILHLPLNGDLIDHSGFGRNGMAVDVTRPPQFSLMDRAVNTSAVFTGDQCIKIPSLTDVEFGPINNAVVSPQVSFAFWWKQLPDGSTMQEGLFGNSLSAEATNVASVRVLTTTTEGIIEAGVRTDQSTTLSSPSSDISDFNFVSAPAGQWNLACLAYDGRLNAALGITPDLRLTILNTATNISNTRISDTDRGRVLNVDKEPVVIGCAQNLPFTGFIDDVRIFLTTLMPEDCLALRAMNDIFC